MPTVRTTLWPDLDLEVRDDQEVIALRMAGLLTEDQPEQPTNQDTDSDPDQDKEVNE